MKHSYHNKKYKIQNKNPLGLAGKTVLPQEYRQHEETGLGLVSGEPADMGTVPRTPAREPTDWEAWPGQKGYVPEVGCPIPHHLVLLQCQPLNHALAIFHELAVKRFFNRSNSP